VEILSGLLDVSIVAFPIYLVSGLQMHAKTKFKVMVGFALRLV
jgi:hypothetical protein